VAGVPVAGQATSFALGTGDVNLLGGTLRPPSLDPLVINVGGNYTQGPGGTLALGVAGTRRECLRPRAGGRRGEPGRNAGRELAKRFPPRGGKRLRGLNLGRCPDRPVRDRRRFFK